MPVDLFLHHFRFHLEPEPRCTCRRAREQQSACGTAGGVEVRNLKIGREPLFGQPADFDQFFDRLEFRIVGQNGRAQALGGRNAKSIGIGERVFAFNFCRGSHERLIDRKEVDGQLFEETERIGGLSGTDTAFDDIVELAPVDPVDDGAGARFVLIVERLLNDLPAWLPVKKTDEGKTIENELFAHGAPRRGVHGGDLESGKIAPLKNPWPSQSDQQEPG